MNSDPKVSVLIVNWNTAEELGLCLEALHRSGAAAGELEIIVLDNASTDGSADLVRRRFPACHLLCNDENLGYARGNNQALERATGRYVLYLNSDVFVEPDTITRLVGILDSRPEVVGVAPRLVQPSGGTQRSVYRLPEAGVLFLSSVLWPAALWRGCPAARRWFADDFDCSVAQWAEQPAASCLLLRREAVGEIAGFDEAFPLYFNDVDLCQRLLERGGRIWYEPDIQATHRHGASTAKSTARRAEHHRSKIDYFAKHFAATRWWGRPALWWMRAIHALAFAGRPGAPSPWEAPRRAAMARWQR